MTSLREITTARLKQTVSITTVMLALLFVPCHLGASTKQSPTWLDNRVTIHSQGDQLHSVLKRIADQSGIIIYFDQQLANERIKGSYKNVKATDLIKRIFSDQNKIILIDDKEKAIIVKTFGVKNLVRIASNQSGDESVSTTLSGMKELHDSQVDEFERELADNDRLVIKNMTLAELGSLHEQQEDAFLAQIGDDSLLPGSTISHSSLQALHEKQGKDFPEHPSVAPLTDSALTATSLETLHNQQDIDFNDTITENTQRIRISAMDLDDLQLLHDQQQQFFDNTQQN